TDGVDAYAIEAAARTFGFPMGPFAFLDEIGLDTALRVGMVMQRAFPDRFPPARLLVTLFKRGCLGRKSGAGFFLYAAGDPPWPPFVRGGRRLGCGASQRGG
ncbi:MAG: hypothetical protein KY476_23530, partial [Planctomycetes bacterium]|nr:hypothetical protein [Planctomycetota bacterium]